MYFFSHTASLQGQLFPHTIIHPVHRVQMRLVLPLPRRQAHDPNWPNRALLTIFFSEPLEKAAQFCTATPTPPVPGGFEQERYKPVNCWWSLSHEVETACLRISSPEDSTIKPENRVLLTSLEPLDPAVPRLGSQLPETIMNSLFCLRQHGLGFCPLTEEIVANQRD